MSGELPIGPLLDLALTYAQLGRPTELAASVADLLRRYPNFSLERFLSEQGAIRDQATLARYLDGVRKAGLRECATADELRKYPKMTHLAVCEASRSTN